MTTFRTHPPLELPALGMWLLACFIAGALGAAFTSPAIQTWYATLSKPSFNPPDWLFGPVWTVLYIMMAVAAWRVWRLRTSRPVRAAIAVFVVQLALNASWSIIFFGLRRPGVAMAELVLLWIAICVTAIAFWRLDKAAGILLIPYLAWVSFAGVLNAAIAAMN